MTGNCFAGWGTSTISAVTGFAASGAIAKPVSGEFCDRCFHLLTLCVNSNGFVQSRAPMTGVPPSFCWKTATGIEKAEDFYGMIPYSCRLPNISGTKTASWGFTAAQIPTLMLIGGSKRLHDSRKCLAKNQPGLETTTCRCRCPRHGERNRPPDCNMTRRSAIPKHWATETTKSSRSLPKKTLYHSLLTSANPPPPTANRQPPTANSPPTTKHAQTTH